MKAVLLYMDATDPGHDYHGHLSNDSRGGASITRRKLRELKKRDSSHPAVCWHEKGQDWAPPTHDARDALIAQLKIIARHVSKA